VPAAGVAGAVVNVTVTGGTQPSYLALFASGQSVPRASNLNWSAGETIANLVTVQLAADGSIAVYNAAGSVDVIVDVEGWVGPPGSVSGGDGFFHPVTPARLFDSRNGSGPVGPGQSITLKVAGAGGVPAIGAEAAVLNVTATNGTASTYLTVYPAGSSRPTASTLNLPAGSTAPNRLMTVLGSNGEVVIYNAAGWVDVIVDVGGWYTDASGLDTSGSMSVLSPARILDTRSGDGATGAVGPGGSATLQVAGRGGVPSMTSSTPPRAVILNLTGTDTTAASFLSVYPGSVRPTVSDLNWQAGETRANLLVVKLAPDGTITLYNASGSVDVVGDVVGWYG